MKIITISVFLSLSITLFGQDDKCSTCHKFFMERNYPKSIECLTEAIETSPADSICLYYFRAYANYMLLKYDSAQKDVNVIIKTNSSAQVEKYYLCNAYFLLSRINSKQNEVQKQLDNLTKALSYMETADILLTLGYAEIKVAKYSGAIMHLTKAIQLDSTSDKAYNNRALAYIKMGDAGKAAPDIEKALALNKKNPYIYKHRGLLFLLTKNKQAACKDFQKAIELGYRDFGNEADQAEVDSLISKNCQ